LKVVEHNFGCHSDTVNLVVTVHQIPSLNLSPLVLLCTGKTVELDPGAGFDSYLWSTGETTQTITVSDANEYSVIASSVCGLAYDTAVVNLIPLPIANAGNDVYIAAGESATLSAELFPNYTYTWDPPEWLSNADTYTTVASPDATTVFNLTVIDQFGCENTDFVTVFVDNDMLTIYNGFTPNGDGFNDTWVIRNIELFPDAEISVYNRSSNVVFKTEGYDNSWNGTHYKTGRKLPFGIYYYVIRIPSANKTFRGSVSILR
jgi:gliding motility-associated-like protein